MSRSGKANASPPPRLATQLHHNTRRVQQLHDAVQVGGRHLALPMEDYPKLSGFGDTNDAYIRVGTQVGAEAVLDALQRAGLKPADVDTIYTTSVTGIKRSADNVGRSTNDR